MEQLQKVASRLPRRKTKEPNKCKVIVLNDDVNRAAKEIAEIIHRAA